MSETEELDYGAMAVAIFDRRTWIHRRVESVTFLTDGSTRRRISFDFTLPAVFARAGFVPLALFGKIPLKAFDLRDASGGAMSLFNADQNAALSAAILRSGCLPSDSSELDDAIANIVYANSDHAEPMQEALNEAQATFENALKSDANDAYRDLVRDLANGFLLTAVLPAGARAEERMVVKLAYEKPFIMPGLIRQESFGTRFDATWAETLHLEVRAPEQLLVGWLSAVGPDANTELVPEYVDYPDGEYIDYPEVEFETSAKQIAHLVIPSRAPAQQPAWMVFVFVAERRGLASSALIASTAAVFAFVAMLAAFYAPTEIGFLPDTGSASSLLLLVPAVIIAFLSRGSEHDVVARHLRPARASLAMTGLLFFLGAANVSGVVPLIWRPYIWSMLLAMAVGTASYMTWWWESATRRAA